MSKFDQEKNFISIYKKLIKNSYKFPFIQIKSNENYFPPNRDQTRQSITSLSNNNQDTGKNNNSTNNNENFSKDEQLDYSNLVNIKQEIKNLYNDNMVYGKNYLDLQYKSIINNVTARGLGIFSPQNQFIGNSLNNLDLANLIGMKNNNNYNYLLFNSQLNYYQSMMMINQIKSKFSSNLRSSSQLQ